MSNFKFKLAAIFASVAIAFCAITNAAEIRVRPEARSAGNIVRLGEVADIFDGNPEEIQALAQIELAPAPATGKQRAITVREIQDTLERRGLNMVFHKISGSSQVMVAAYSDAPKPVAKPKVLPTSTVQVAERAVGDSIVRYLQDATQSDEPWTIDLELTPEQAQLVLADVNHVTAHGGNDPWIGKQKFEIAVRTDGTQKPFTINAEVSAPSAVVVTVQNVPRGSIIQPSDVTLQRMKPGSYADDAFKSLDAVIGREAVRAMAQGQILDPDYVRTPTLVKRGSVVTVFVRSAGVKIRTTGKARDNGGSGDTITIESLLDRKSYEAKVIGIDQVEVNADPVMATASPATEMPRLPASVTSNTHSNSKNAVRRASANLPTSRGNE